MQVIGYVGVSTEEQEKEVIILDGTQLARTVPEWLQGRLRTKSLHEQPSAFSVDVSILAMAQALQHSSGAMRTGDSR